MKNIKIITFLLVFILGLCSTKTAEADLRVEDFYPKAESLQLTANSALVWNLDTGQVLFSKDPTASRVPASLTKLVTAMVVLDSKTSLKKICTLRPDNEVGGARLAAKTGSKFTLNDALTASLVGSLNNTTNMVAGCIGLSKEQFTEKMNKKALSLGAVNSVFYEPTGMDPRNMVTAEDVSRIAKAAFTNGTIQKMSQKPTFTLCSLSNPKACYKVKNTDVLLLDKSIKVVGGKTGYLDEAMFNFTAVVKDKSGSLVGVVVLGSNTKANSFAETKRLAEYASQTKLWNQYSPQILAINN